MSLGRDVSEPEGQKGINRWKMFLEYFSILHYFIYIYIFNFIELEVVICLKKPNVIE